MLSPDSPALKKNSKGALNWQLNGFSPKNDLLILFRKMDGNDYFT